MEKKKTYDLARFSADVIKEALDVLNDTISARGKDLQFRRLEVLSDQHTTWAHDSLEEFFADYRQNHGEASLMVQKSEARLTIFVHTRNTGVWVEAPNRVAIEAVFGVFEKHLLSSRLPPLPAPARQAEKVVVFIGHGRSLVWRDLKDHLQDKHGIRVESYETGARAGHTIRDILEDMTKRSSFALLVLTAEDEQADGGVRARQNVVHETGLFQGCLGFSRAIVLREDGTEDFSNIDGIQQIRFARGNIRETFGDVLATIRREFGGS